MKDIPIVPARPRPRRNPWKTSLEAVKYAWIALVPLPLFCVVAGYVWLMMHGVSIGAFEVIEVTEVVERTAKPEYIAYTIFGGAAVIGALVALYFWGAHVYQLIQQKAREWEEDR